MGFSCSPSKGTSTSEVSDIDSQRMCLRIIQGKGQKDRYVPLSELFIYNELQPRSGPLGKTPVKDHGY